MDVELFGRFRQSVNELAEHCCKFGLHIKAATDKIDRALGEVLETLDRPLETCAPELKSVYQSPSSLASGISDQCIYLLDRLDGIATDSRDLLERLPSWRNKYVPLVARLADNSSMTEEDQVLITRWTTAVEIAPTLWKFYTVVPVLGAVSYVESYHKALHSFLGRKPGKRTDLAAAVEVLVKATRDALFDSVTFQFASVISETTIRFFTSPLERDVWQFDEANQRYERPLVLGRSLREVWSRGQMLSNTLQICSDGISASVNSIECEREALQVLINKQRSLAVALTN